MLQVRGVSKSFPGVKSLDRVDFAVAAGEVRALVGENRAGKSTLTKVVAGVYQPEDGTIGFGGRTVRWSSPHEARDAGIHRSLACRSRATRSSRRTGRSTSASSRRPTYRRGFLVLGLAHRIQELKGVVEPDLSPAASAAKEALEEAGIRARSTMSRLARISTGNGAAPAPSRCSPWRSKKRWRTGPRPDCAGGRG